MEVIGREVPTNSFADVNKHKGKTQTFQETKYLL